MKQPKVRAGLVAADVNNSKLIAVRNQSYNLPDADNVERTVEYLDTRGDD